MARAFSPSALDKLGKRLRGVPPDPGDLDALLAAQREWDPALQHVLAVVSAVVAHTERHGDAAPLHVTHREKTVATLVDKLRRGTQLSRMQDVVGVRIVDPGGGLGEQDDIVARLAKGFAHVHVDDRRTRPNQGYRAVHVVPEIDGYRVEIQVRTGWQVVDRRAEGALHEDAGISKENLMLMLDEHRVTALQRAVDELTTLMQTGGAVMDDFGVELKKWPLRKDWR